jgi:phosphate transport system substrate-binding protein
VPRRGRGVDSAGRGGYSDPVSGVGRAIRARHLWATVLFAACAAWSCSPSPPRETAPPASIVLAGAENLLPLFRGEVLAFRDRYPGAAPIRIQGNGSAEGMEQLVNGDVAMAVLTRELTDPEVKAAVSRAGLNAYTVAWDAVAVIVHPSCPVEQISRTELGEIYGGHVAQWARIGWRAGGDITPLTTDPKLGLYEYIRQTILGGGAYGSGVYAQPSEQDIVRIVAERPGAIGMVSQSLVDDRVRTLRVSEAIGLPYTPLTRETLVLKTYPLLRGVSLCTPKEPAATAADFITFVSGLDGQRIVARHGYGPATVPVQIVRTMEEE